MLPLSDADIPDAGFAFHPAIARWLERRFGAPTSAQAKGWPAIQRGEHTLIAAPTGSGKTLAAFLASIDELLRESLAGDLGDETRVLYISPLKALSNDIHKNLMEPLSEVEAILEEMGLPKAKLRAAVRTGDTPQSARQALAKKPPHLLVTTPESLYLLLTSASGQRMLSTVRTVIIDEIHALAPNRRGAHLALSVERLEALTGPGLQRIGLSATQRPIEEVARFLVGAPNVADDGAPVCHIVDEGHRRASDLAIELPRSELEAVMAGEVWGEVYDRITELIREHKTTLVFVNTRRLAERVAAHLAERLGEDQVTSHHGSLSAKRRLDAEDRLKRGELRALVATASLELGIDVGAVDLVVQIGPTNAIATFLQRVGRSGHFKGGVPKGRLFPLTRDELAAASALVRAVRQGALDRLEIPPRPLDVLAQQIVAACAARDWEEDALFEVLTRAWPYRGLERREFDDVVRMLAEGFRSGRGTRAYLYHDGAERTLRSRKGARIAALTSGGAIPDNADYAVVAEPTGVKVGSINEDFAIESLPGDVFQLGNTSWRILRVERGVVRVEDAQGQPPTIPFWLGEAPARTDELSESVSKMREEIEPLLDDLDEAQRWLQDEVGLSESAAEQLARYLLATKQALGVLPRHDTLVVERFLDELGGAHLVIHAPFGGRVMRAWGLALRKRFCRTYNFELQAAANEDALVLSVGADQTFDLADIPRFLHSNTVRKILVQALLDAPMFQTRWRWNASRALAVLRQRGGRRVPGPLQRIEAEDLLVALFPDSLACLENIVGDREVPDHPLVNQTLEDCLTEAMDIDRLEQVLRDLEAGAIRAVCVESPEPSPLAHEILNAKPYAFLDDVPLEERRVQAIFTRRSAEPRSAEDVGALDPEALARVLDEVSLEVTSSDEAHDALLLLCAVPEPMARAPAVGAGWLSLLEDLAARGRATRLDRGAGRPALWMAAERLEAMRKVFPEGGASPDLSPREHPSAAWDRDTALKELLRGHLEVSGPVTARELSERLGLSLEDVERGLAPLEAEGNALRGYFSPVASERQFFNRRILMRVQRLTLGRLRAEIEPVPSAAYLRFLFGWHRLPERDRGRGPDAVPAALSLLEGFEAPALAWESEILPARLLGYSRSWLDPLCLSGRLVWGRMSAPPAKKIARLSWAPLTQVPIALVEREHAGCWQDRDREEATALLGGEAKRLLSLLEGGGAFFFHDLVARSGLLKTHAERALAQLVGAGLVTADGLQGLRALITPSKRRRGPRGRERPGMGIEGAGRWSLLTFPRAAASEASARRRSESLPDDVLEHQARALLRRYGVLARRLLERESLAAPWRDLTRVLRRMEMRGDVRGGRFIAGLTGEQFALPEAVGPLRSARSADETGELVRISAADPLNLVGIVTPGERVPSLTRNRVLFKDGVPIAALDRKRVRSLLPSEDGSTLEVTQALLARPLESV